MRQWMHAECVVQCLICRRIMVRLIQAFIALLFGNLFGIQCVMVMSMLSGEVDADLVPVKISRKHLVR